MDIKSFVIRINEDGSYTFVDKKDEEAFKRTLSFLNKNKNIKTLELSLKTTEENSTDKQINFFNLLCRKISLESGDDYMYIKALLLNNSGFKLIEEVPKEEFQPIIDKTIFLAKEYFNIDISINPNNNHIEIN